MAEPICEDEGLLQEWCPLTHLVQQIPLKVQKGLFSQNLNLTCLDVVSEYIALGTNSGLVYWYCRVNGELQRLRLEDSKSIVTCIKVVSTVDYMIAAGTQQGTVIVFDVPKTVSDSIPDKLKPKKKEIERFTINGLHDSPITNIEWSQNGMKLFSGDKNGVVVLTEIDFSLHLSKSMELLNEKFEVIQLSYNQQLLLISTLYRSIICDGTDNWKTYQVGKKERKMLGKFGATFCKFDHGLVLYASRPGQRLWLTDKFGVVQQTLIFKSAVHSTCPKIQLINPVNTKDLYDTSFGKVLQFGDNKLITYNSDILYILHPGAVSIVSILDSARRILDLAVNENEIFILEGERSLLRISPLPDKYSMDILCQSNSRRTSFNFDDFAAKIKDTAVGSIKKITKDLVLSPDELSLNSDPVVAVEALELPPVVPLSNEAMSSIVINDSQIQFCSNEQGFLPSDFTNTKIGEEKNLVTNDNFIATSQDCQEEVISRPLRKRHNKKSKNLIYAQVIETESDTTSNASEDRLVWGTINDMSLSEDSAMSQSNSSFSVLRDIPTLLQQQKICQKNKKVHDERLKNEGSKSQESLDTCESVSERLMSLEKFCEEQEKAFARLANKSLLDSFNSEKTDNMSVSLNMTTSSSISSKISENLQSPFDLSDSSSMISGVKTVDSQSTDSQNQQNYLKKYMSHKNWSINLNENNLSSQKEKETDSVESVESLAISRDSQKERLYNNKWSKDRETIKDINSADEYLQKSLEKPSALEPNILNDDSETITNKNDLIISQNKIYLIGQPQEKNLNSELDSMYLEKQISETANNLNNYLCWDEFSSKCNDEIGEEEKKENKLTNKSLSSFEPITYGPPSGSSMLSSQPSSGFSSMPNNSQICQPLYRDFPDHWPQYKIPEPITSLAVCKNYVICTDFNDSVYYSDISGLSLSWVLLDYKASSVRTSNDGTMVWLLNEKSVMGLVNPSHKHPIASTMKEIAQNVKSFAIDGKKSIGWIVTLGGKIMRYKSLLNLEEQETAEEIPCEYIVTEIACLNDTIVALLENHSLICKPPKKNKFFVLKTFRQYTSAFFLGPYNLLWVVDDRNEIYFSNDFQNDNPHWWQIYFSDCLFQNSPFTFQNIYSKIKLNKSKKNNQLKTIVAADENSVWIFDKQTSTIRLNKTLITGYMWNNISSKKDLSNIKFQAICAEGVFEDKSQIWLLSLDENIFCTSPKSQQFQSIPAPCEDKILCMASATDTLWVLSENGRIYSRLGLSENNFSGNSWRELKLPQTDNLRLIWISCGCDVAWGCDIHGRTFITIGSPHHMSTNIFDAAWLEVEGGPKGVHFQKVFVGPQLYMVWAIDKKGNLYVREGIFSHYQIGTSWVRVSGFDAIHVTISGTSVWALTSKGQIYRRCGITETNYIGDFWKSFPGIFKIISSSYTEDLWGITDKNEILQLNEKVIYLDKGKMGKNEVDSQFLKEDISWEIVE